MDTTESTLPSSASPDTAKATLNGQGGQFTLLVHSQDSVSQDTTPEVDNIRLTRPKRRRTSPEDHAILEAEYEKNPKPDKAARIEIVNRVALGEKEVQIWFQNRRQMTRRKTKPLMSTEIFSNFLSSQAFSSASSSSHSAVPSSQQQFLSGQSSVLSSQSAIGGFPMTLPVKPLAATVNSNIPEVRPAHSSINNVTTATNINSINAIEVAGTSAPSDGSPPQSNPTNFVRPLSQSGPSKGRPAYLANRRSFPFILHDEQRDFAQSSKEIPKQTSSIGDTITSSQALKRILSQVRLSLSLDGKAEVTTRTGMTPSPPRSQSVSLSSSAPRSHVGLQRSYSALETTDKPVQDMYYRPYSRRAMTGRSRDARTWEFYCDSDARNALTEQAEREEKGSATAAISLIRSHSNKNKAVTPNSNKRNAHSQKADSAKRLKRDGRNTNKPKLARAISSVARLQMIDGNISKQDMVNAGDKGRESCSQSALYQEYEGDSDKENWEPGTQTSNQRRRRPVKSQQAARILEESLRYPSQSSSLDNLMNRTSTSSQESNAKSLSSVDKDNSASEGDDKVATSMGEDTPREEADLDCVQNLLSLSQAAWQ